MIIMLYFQKQVSQIYLTVIEKSGVDTVNSWPYSCESENSQLAKNFLSSIDCVCGKVLALCCASKQMLIASGVMEQGQLLTDLYIKNMFILFL